MKKTLFILLAVLGITTVGHALALPQATRCLFIDFYDFERSGRLYYRPDTSPEKMRELEQLIAMADERVASFWGNRASNPKIIFCENAEDYSTFGSAFSTPAATIMHIRPFIVLSGEGVDLDIIAHELAHAELFAQVGILNNTFQLPVWFHEGIAMQVDDRAYYSIDTLAAKTDGFQNLPDVKAMKTYAQFGHGTREEVMLHYMTAKYEVRNWYTPNKLKQFILDLDRGLSFEAAYGNMETYDLFI